MNETIDFTIKTAKIDERDILVNLYALYGNDISEFTPLSDVNERGMFEFEDVDDFLTDVLLIPYLIWIDEKPSGFLLLGKGEHALEDCDYIIYDLFIIRKYRRKGVSSKVMKTVFDANPGRYCVCDLEINTAAVNFWKNIIKQYDNNFVEESFTTPNSEKFLCQIFNVNNSKSFGE